MHGGRHFVPSEAFYNGPNNTLNAIVVKDNSSLDEFIVAREVKKSVRPAAREALEKRSGCWLAWSRG
jgi:hypothetical protein